ncbi:hypothetical protein SLA2020_407550 [Shorea laevis]
MEKFDNDTDNAKKYFVRVCPNPKAGYQDSRKVEEYLEDIAQLLEEAARLKIPDSNKMIEKKQTLRQIHPQKHKFTKETNGPFKFVS